MLLITITLYNVLFDKLFMSQEVIFFYGEYLINRTIPISKKAPCYFCDPDTECFTLAD